MMLNTWPLVTSPTGTEIGPPVSRTATPRTMPSVGFIEIARTRLSPMCCATSRVSVARGLAHGHVDLERVVDLRHRVGRELDVDDRADHPGDPADPAAPLGGGVSTAVAVMSLSLSPGWNGSGD